ELRVSDSLSVASNWYQDAFRRADGADVDCRVVQADDGSFVVTVASTEARKTSGISVDIHLSKTERGIAEARASGTWWSDRGPRRGRLDSIKGVISINSADFAHERPLWLQFNLDTNWSGCPKSVSGGIRIPR